MARELHRLYASLMGYFWLPCPACGEMFGGHEASDEATPDDRVVCRDCAPAIRRERERFQTRERVSWGERYDRIRAIAEARPEHPSEPGHFASAIEFVGVGAAREAGDWAGFIEAEITVRYARPPAELN